MRSRTIAYPSKAPPGKSSLEYREELSPGYQWRDAKCPYCRRHPFHVAVETVLLLPSRPSEVRINPGPGFDFHFKDGCIHSRRNDLPTWRKPDDPPLPPPKGPRVREIGPRVFAECHPRCRAQWILSRNDVTQWAIEAADKNQKSFTLPKQGYWY